MIQYIRSQLINTYYLQYVIYNIYFPFASCTSLNFLATDIDTAINDLHKPTAYITPDRSQNFAINLTELQLHDNKCSNTAVN